MSASEAHACSIPPPDRDLITHLYSFVLSKKVLEKWKQSSWKPWKIVADKTQTTHPLT